MIKTNKSFAKRLKTTKTGKVIARKAGQNHFRAKQSRKSELSKKRTVGFVIRKKTITKLLPAN
jgi:ribosomal protein L35